jgi:hypothetical protein
MSSILEDDIPGLVPGATLVRVYADHVFVITATNQVGCDTGRRRYRVECRSCHLLVHAASTSARAQVKYHLRQPSDGEPLTPSSSSGKD